MFLKLDIMKIFLELHGKEVNTQIVSGTDLLQNWIKLVCDN
jgi:hypothetical protein